MEHLRPIFLGPGRPVYRSSRQTFCLISRCRFHDYFTTHLPSSSLHPDSRAPVVGHTHHKLPRASSTPHTPSSTSRSPSALPSAGPAGPSRDTTIVRIPLKSAKHHFGASSVRGSRPYNEDTWQAGTIEIPAFANRQPISLNRKPSSSRRPNAASTKAADANQAEGGYKQGQNASGDPQVFYFGVFDGHGGEECSDFLRQRLHGYLEDGAEKFGLRSSLGNDAASTAQEDKQQRRDKIVELEEWLVNEWRKTVGGYFRRFKPEYFISSADAQSEAEVHSLNTMLTFAFLNADLQFTQAQAHKSTGANAADDPVLDDKPINEHDLLSHPLRPASQNLTSLLQAPIGGATRFKGGSTCSVALISTPTAMPFWNPASPSTLVVAHVGDTRIILCRVSDGVALPLTSDHHPSAPIEAARLRRYAASFVTDSFGEERMQGLANTRAFGDIATKRVGVSAEPEITTTELKAGEYSFLVLMSDGVSAVLDDQEVADIVKEARTPDAACRDVVNFATEVSEDADNATCLVIRLGGWERRGEGGGGSLGTREKREFRRREAETPRSRTQ